MPVPAPDAIDFRIAIQAAINLHYQQDLPDGRTEDQFVFDILDELVFHYYHK